jgi:RNA polymerase sigma-70 factor (ECF subfamily)
MSHNGVTSARFGSSPGSTSSSLLIQAKAQEPHAWQQLVDLYTPLLYHSCRRAGLSMEDTADTVQEVFVSVFTSLDYFRGAQVHGSFRAWLRKIAQSRIADLYRRKQRQSLDPRGLDAGHLAARTEPTPTLGEEDTPEIQDAIWHRGMVLVRAEYEEQTWQAFWRVVVDAQKPADVAEELGMSLAAVYQAKSRVLRRLHQQFGDLEGDG